MFCKVMMEISIVKMMSQFFAFTIQVTANNLCIFMMDICIVKVNMCCFRNICVMDFPRQRFEILHRLKVSSLLASEDIQFESQLESPVFKTTACRIGFHFSLVIIPRGGTYCRKDERPTSYPDTLGIYVKRKWHMDRFCSRNSCGPVSISFFVDVNDKRKCVTEVCARISDSF